MEKKENVMILLCAGIFALGINIMPAKAEDSALGQLQGMDNTGVTFDGSDGQRSGMDINVNPSGGYNGIDPVPVQVDSNDYQAGTSSGTQSSDYSSDDSSYSSSGNSQDSTIDNSEGDSNSGYSTEGSEQDNNPDTEQGGSDDTQDTEGIEPTN